MTLAEIQARLALAIMTPLSGSDSMARRTSEGKPMRAEVSELIKPNDRLTAVERLEIYSRSYWFRILDGMGDDFPGLRAVLGTRAFDKMARAYLADCPSRSYTMRNLGSQLAEWLEAHAEFAGSSLALALDMARLEWAHIEAYDGAELKPLGPEDLLEPGPDLRIGLQPYLSLLALQYPVDDIRIEAGASGADEQHDTASNTVGEHKHRSLARRVRRAQPQSIHLVVHRMDGSVYYRRLGREEYLVLQGLRAGRPIGEALEIALADCAIPPEELSGTVEQWFASWSRLGWLCAPGEETVGA